MKGKLAFVLPLAFILALFDSTCFGQAGGTGVPQEGFGRLLGAAADPGSSAGSPGPGVPGTAIPVGADGVVNAGMPITGVDQPSQMAPRSEPNQGGMGQPAPAPQGPPPAEPEQPQQQATPDQPGGQAPAKPGPGTQAKPRQGVQTKPGQGSAKKPVVEQPPKRSQAKQTDLAQLINGSWRVQFSTGASATMPWRYDPQRNIFFDGSIEYTVQFSGNTLQMRGRNPSNGVVLVFTLQFKSMSEAYGTMMIESGPNMQGQIAPVQFQAVKVN